MSDDVAIKDVICAKCRKAHEREFEECPTQGAGCAADVWMRSGRLAISATYGSRHDMQTFHFERGDHGLNVGDLVCDECIESMLKIGAIVEYVVPMSEMCCTWKSGCEEPVVEAFFATAVCAKHQKDRMDTIRRMVASFDKKPSASPVRLDDTAAGETR